MDIIFLKWSGVVYAPADPEVQLPLNRTRFGLNNDSYEFESVTVYGWLTVWNKVIKVMS